MKFHDFVKLKYQILLQGRNGKGIIYVWATGNGGVHDDDCGCDGYVSSPYSLSVGSITDRGQAPYFDEKCASTLTVVPSGGEIRAGEFEGQPKIKVVSNRRKGLKNLLSALNRVAICLEILYITA